MLFFSPLYSFSAISLESASFTASIELAPLLGLSDVIVDIVETGNTLKANHLEPKELILPISARLIANKSGFKFKTKEIEAVKEALSREIAENE